MPLVPGLLAGAGAAAGVAALKGKAAPGRAHFVPVGENYPDREDFDDDGLALNRDRDELAHRRRFAEGAE